MANDVNSRSGQKQQKKKPKKKRNIGSVLFKIFVGAFFLGCVGLLSGIGLFWYYASDVEELSDERLETVSTSRMFDANDDFLLELGNEKRETISPNEVPQLLEDAIISIEDRRFYNHIGVDPIRIVGSALNNVLRGGMQGGSTITQQLIKLSYFSTGVEDQTLKRKAQEAVLSVQLEREKSKQEILTYYINKVYMSNGLYGMETAAEAFYGKTLGELDLAQTALIAGIPNAPSDFDPYAYEENAKYRRDIVLLTMLQNEKITQAEYDQAVAVPITEGLQDISTQNNNWKYFDNYLSEVLQEVYEKTGQDPYQGGLDIYTNLDMDAQRRLYDIVNTDEYVTDYPDDEMQVAATLIEADTGKVRAQIGGRNFDEASVLNENLATNNRRDFGSTVKPIVDYGPAIEYLNYSTGKIIVDEPYNYEGTNIAINNWDRRYMGSMTMRQALVLSRNVPAAKLFWEVGADKISEFLSGLDIYYENLEQSNAISSNTSVLDEEKYYGVSSLKMAAAYAAFANGGIYNKPSYVNRVVYHDGSEEVNAFQSESSRAMKATTAYMITDMLKGVVAPANGSNATIPGLYHAGKTGTSNYTDEQLANLTNVDSPSPDSNFVGYSPHYSLAVWTGYREQNTPITSQSSHIAATVYRLLMQYVSSSLVNEDWTMPDGLIRVGNELYLEDHYEQPQPSYSSTVESTTETSTTEESTTEESTTEESTSETSETEVEPEPTEESSEETTPPSSSEQEQPTPPESSEAPVEENPPSEEGQ